MVAGVLGGLGRQIGIDPIVLRIATAVLALFGGVGVLLYALAWLLIPADDEAGSVADQALGRVEPRGRNAGPLAVGLVVAALAACSLVISGSLVPVLLLTVTVGGAYAYARRSSSGTDDNESVDPRPVDDRDGLYPRSWPRDDSGASVPPTPTDAAPHGTARPAGGTGWPDGPDWGTSGPFGEPPWADAPEPDASLPQIPTPAQTKPKKRSPLTPITICLALVAVGTLAVNDVTWATFSPALYVAVALAIIGAGLVIGSWFGRSRGLITLGILLSLALVPATWAAQWSGPTGQFRETIDSIQQLPADPVEYGGGQITYSLSDLEVPKGEEAALSIELGFGELIVFVPREANLDVQVSMGAGSALIRNEPADGLGVNFSKEFRGDPDVGTIVLNLDMGAGDIKVVNR
jgi:phage shock protein PspC (stress-responsive transcriptional regulator)